MSASGPSGPLVYVKAPVVIVGRYLASGLSILMWLQNISVLVVEK